MAVPYLKRALKGWTKIYLVTLYVQTVVNSKTVNTPATPVKMKLNKQLLKPAKVNRKPPEQRTWKWWNIIVEEGPELKTDDKLSIEGIDYKVMSARDWIESGFRKYEAIEGYM